MIYAAPMPFKEALQAHQVKTLLPTSGRTRELQQLSSDIKRRALFSATVENAELLQKVDDMADGILSGQSDQASTRLVIKEFLDDLGYVPDAEKAGSIEDISSDSRLNLILETNVETARGYGWFTQGQQQDVLDEWPTQELIRFTVPKGGAQAERDWASRWAEVGGQFFDGRMIALKNDPIWDQLGSPDNFDDGLGNPYPPFAFNSGMNVRDVSRDEAVSLGLIDENTELLPKEVGLNDTLQASPDIRSKELRSMMEDTGLGSFNKEGIFEFSGGGE